MFADRTGSARPGDHGQLETLKTYFAHSDHAGQRLGYHEVQSAYPSGGPASGSSSSSRLAARGKLVPQTAPRSSWAPSLAC